MTKAMNRALKIAAQECADIARIESDSDPELARALDAVAAMLGHLGAGKASVPFNDLKKRLADTVKAELNGITDAVAGYLMLCGQGQNAAARIAVKECGHSTVKSVKQRALLGAETPGEVHLAKDWLEIQRRVISARRQARYIEPKPQTAAEVDAFALHLMVSQALEIKKWAELITENHRDSKRSRLTGRASNGLV